MPEPEKLLLSFYDLGLGGVQTKIIDIVNHIGKKFPKTQVCILLRTRSDFDLGFKIKNENIILSVYEEEMPRVRGPFFFTIFVLWRCYTFKPDAMLGFLSPFSLPLILARLVFFWRKTRLVINEDCFTSGVLGTYKYQVLNALGIRYLYPLADAVIVPTAAVRQDLIESYRIPADVIHIIRNWTSIKKRGVFVPKGGYDLLYAGRLDPLKRVDRLIEAIAVLRDQHGNITLLVAGSGTQEKSLRAMVTQRGLREHIKFRKPSYDILALFRQAKIFIFSSSHKGEGFPFVVLEAMAYGIPVVSYRFAGSDETIHDRKNGMLYDSIDGLVDTCSELLDIPSLRRKLAKAAQVTIRNEHSSRNIGRYAQLLGFG
jgi:glycosyltransferase involved in cell wall biosynthesis